MQSLPFRLFVADDLDLQNAVRRDHHKVHPPGAVEEAEPQVLWLSKPDTVYPLELGLILLSAQPATVKSISITVELTRAPAQISIFSALPSHNGKEMSYHSLDAVSRYLSAVWQPCCEPIVWEPCSPDTPRSVDIKTVRLKASLCSFLKLVVNAGQSNYSRQIAIEDIELRGTMQTSHLLENGGFPSQSVTLDHIHRPILPSSVYDNDDLQTVLLDAGVPMELVAQVVSFELNDFSVKAVTRASMHEEDIPSSTKAMSGSESSISDTKPEEAPQNPGLSPQESGKKDEHIDKEEPISPFDIALRQHVEQTARETATLEDILTTEIRKSPYEVSTWQSPTISPTDPANINEITLYTFGAFFTQCLLCGGPAIQTVCIQTAERCARILKDSVGATTSFEGVIALIALALREAKSPEVFQAAIHLAHTVFLTELVTTMKHVSQPQLSLTTSNDRRSDTAPTTKYSSLGLIEEISRANWSHGLQIVLVSAITSPLCWCFSIRANLNTKEASSLPPSIDRDFLRFIRLLLSQDLTRESVFEELHGIKVEKSTSSSLLAINRLRLLRLILRSDTLSSQLPGNVKDDIHSLCSSYATEALSTKLRGDRNSNKQRSHHADPARLAMDCLKELNRISSTARQNNDEVKSLKQMLTSVRRQLNGSENPKSYFSNGQPHTVAFVQFPFTNTEAAEWALQMKLYFSAQPRPRALYRHAFLRGSHIDKENDIAETHEVFQKGNIAFRGQVISRTPPTSTFHDQIQQKTMPFVFDVRALTNTKSEMIIPLQQSDHQEVVSSFAAFRGIIEQRSHTPSRTSRVITKPAPAPSSTKISSATPMKQSTTANVSSVNPPQLEHSAQQKFSNESSKELPVPSSGDIINQAPVVIPTGNPPETSPIATQQPNTQETSALPQPIDLPKNQGKGKRKGKAKSKGSSNAKEPDNCVLQ